METEDQICRRFEAELAAIAVLDHRYYLSLSPTTAERADYAARQIERESIRSRYYAELAFLHEHKSHQCFTIIVRKHYC